MDDATPPLVNDIATSAAAPVESVLALYESVGEDDRAFVQRIVETGIVRDEEAWAIYALSLGIDFEDFDAYDLDPELLQKLTPEDIAGLRAVPVRWDDGLLVVAMENPTDLSTIDALQNALQVPILPAVATPHAIDVGLDCRRRADQGLEALLARLDLSDMSESAFANPQALKDIAGDDAIVQLCDHVLEQALRRKASDIHIEASREHLRVRLRIDGRLETLTTLPRSIHAPMVTRLKLVSHLDISERRKPQDGRFRIARSAHKSVEFRVSVLPAMHGEKVVMRVLDASKALLALADLGFAPDHEAALVDAAESPNGMVLVTGPTGSGKSTTLYGVLNHLNRTDRNLITAEDPVEYEMGGITQVHIDKKAGRSFADTLRAILRQDPDVIMVGEIRDHETAEIAVHAAMTGHMVLSTLHTNSALGTVSRLVDMGIEPYLLGPALRAIVAQRLVRRLCPSCATPGDPPVALLESFGIDTVPDDARFLEPRGCAACRGKGFVGRIAVHEVLAWTDAMDRCLSGGGSEADLAGIAREAGFETMLVNGAQKAMQGCTSLREVIGATRA